MCPLGMTDGAARALELSGSAEMKNHTLPLLTSPDPDLAVTSGQWMTERPGGSDVSQTETTATPDPNSFLISPRFGPVYNHSGLKWFSSTAEADFAVGLARTGPPDSGSRGLSLFLIPLRFESLSPLANGIRTHRLKNKFGTAAVPTAELELENTKAWLLSPLNLGVKAITLVLNISRVHSAIHSIGSLQRCLAIARAYARERRVEGGKTLLKDIPLHVATLAKVSLLYRALTHLTFGVVTLLGKYECGTASSEEELRFRLLTSVIKAFAADRAPTAMEECMAAVGGQGYMEEVAIGRLIRDSMVERIWGSTINFLALDLFRATRNEKAICAFRDWASVVIEVCPEKLSSGPLQSALVSLKGALDQISGLFMLSPEKKNPLLPRPALNLLAHVAAGMYLLEHATWTYHASEDSWSTDVDVFLRWVNEGGLNEARDEAVRVSDMGNTRVTDDFELVYGVVPKPEL